MNLIKSSSFKSGSFKGEEHSYIDSVNGTIKGLGEAGTVLPDEHVYFEHGTDKESDDISTHEDQGLANIKEFVPLVHRDLQAILYRGVSYVLSGGETKFNDVSEDVMKLIQNIVRLVDSKITIIHHFAEIQEARNMQSDSDGCHNCGEHLRIPNSTTVEYPCDGDHSINMFDTVGDTEEGRADLIANSVNKVLSSHLNEARQLITDIVRGVNSLNVLAINVYRNEHNHCLSHAGLRVYYLNDALNSMSLGLQSIYHLIQDRMDQEHQEA